MSEIRVALVGDRNPEVVAHRAIPIALALIAKKLGCPIRETWCATDTIGPDADDLIRRFDAVWCVPASPYASAEGALAAIRAARVSGTPFLGTCGGCQHAVLEFARNVLGLANADHAESNPDATLPLISALKCALVEESGAIRLERETRIYDAYGRDEIIEAYHCSYGLNPSFEHLLDSTALRISGREPGGEARSLELIGPAFFVLAQFQPERAALDSRIPPLVEAFIRATRHGRPGV